MLFCTSLIRKCFDSYSGGAWREVYLSPSRKYVIKFNHRDMKPGMRIAGSNIMEYQTYQYFRDNPDKLPQGVRIPDMWFDGEIIIAQFIKGERLPYCGYEHQCNTPDDCPNDKLDDVPINDLNWTNVLIDSDGVIWIIDLGNGSELLDNYYATV